MHIFDAAEIAYKNGYEKGYKDALTNIKDACSVCETLTPTLIDEMVKVLLNNIATEI